MVLVFGGTGVAGAEVVRALLQRGRPVRALVRDPDGARRRLGDEVELARGDFADAASVRAALDGAQEVLLSCADDPRRVGWETSAIDAAVAAGVSRVVKLSSIAVRPGSPVAFWDWHGRVEAHLRAAPVASVVLRCAPFMSNLLAAAEPVAREGRLYAPAGDARIAMVDPRDVGASAAAVLAGPHGDREAHVLTGPEALTYATAAEALGTVTGHPVEYVPVSDETARQGLLAAGVPESAATQIVAIYSQLRGGVGEPVTTSVETLTGVRARDLATFLRDHARAFMSGHEREAGSAMLQRPEAR